jgi:hypothetical protein
MFRLFSRPARRSRGPRRQPRALLFGVQQLETRDCPSGPAGGVPSNGEGHNQPPSIASFSVSQAGHHDVRLEGSVSDDGAVSGLTVNFTGVVNGSTCTDDDGDFSVVLTASALGTITATAMDEGGLSSDPCNADLTNVAPSISVSARQVAGGCWIIEGSVSDEWAYGLTVTLSSSNPLLDGVSVEVGSNGGFEFSILDPTANLTGTTVAASVTDWWDESDTSFTSIG